MFKKKKILVLGDIMLDEYLIGDSTRLSPEGPVPIVNLQERFFKCGGAGNVAINLVSLGQDVWLGGVIGPDGAKLRSLLKDSGIHAEGVVVDPHRKTTVKTRVISGTQHITRIDSEDTTEYKGHDTKFIPQDIDCIVFSDYAKGYLTYEFCNSILTKYSKLISIVDPKTYDYIKFNGCTVFKPNRKELMMFGRGAQTVSEAIEAVRERLECKYLLATLGKEGMCLAEAEKKPKYISTYSTEEAVDITGAGDTVSAVLAAGLTNGFSILDTVKMASFAADVKVKHLGNYSVTIEDFKRYAHGKTKITKH